MSSSENESASARSFANTLGAALERVSGLSEEASHFARDAATALRTGRLSPATPLATGTRRYAQWTELMALARAQHDCDLVDAIELIEPELCWIEGNHFWPEERYRYFANHMTGAMVFGEPGSPYMIEQRCIVLLHVQMPHAIYPLHEHRIPEAYYIVAGNNEWTHDGVVWERHQPGELFYNASWQPHAIRTGDEPSLSLDVYLPPFGWEGGLCGDDPRTP